MPTEILHRDLKDKAQVTYAYDGMFVLNDKKIIDASSNVINANLGYSQSTIIDAMKEQAKQLPFMHDSFGKTKIQKDLAQLISNYVNNENYYMYFCSSGSETVEMAIRTSFLYHEGKRMKALSYEGSYHGSTGGALSVSGSNAIKSFAYMVKSNSFIKVPCCNYCNVRCCENCNYIKQLVERLETREYYCIVIDPMGSNALGFLKYSNYYFKKLIDTCLETDTILICDEITTSIGRTGKSFSYMHYGNYSPDIICCSKGLGVGYANVGCTIVNSKVIKKLHLSKINLLGNTFNSHPIACAAAVEALRIIDLENYIIKNKIMGEKISAIISTIKKHKLVKSVMGCGLWYSINFVPSSEINYGKLIQMECIQDGCHILSSQVYNDSLIYSHLSFAPPFISNLSNISMMLSMIDKCIVKVEDKYEK